MSDSSALDVLEITSEERALVEAWARLVHVSGKRKSAVLLASEVSLVLAVRACTSILAVPQRDPPQKALALLAEDWHEEPAVRTQLVRGLGEHLFEDGWTLGSLAVRGIMKAVLGQMPPNSLGVVVSAVRGVLRLGPASLQ